MRKKSDVRKNLDGTFRKDRAGIAINWMDIPEKPAFTDSVASTAWDVIVAELSGVGLLSKLDSQILETACLLFSRIKVVAESLLIQGETIIDLNGATKLNPLAKCLRDYCSTFDTLCNSLG